MFGVYRWGLLCLMVVSQGAFAAEPLWLSDTPPGQSAHGGGHSHGGGEGGRRGAGKKGLWLRAGDSPTAAAYAGGKGATRGVLIDPAKRVSELPLQETGAGAQLSFPFADEGFYNAYVTRRHVVDGVLEVSVAKAEILNHSCRNGHDHVKNGMPYNSLAGLPLEIVRERMPKEDFHSRTGFGDEVALRVLARGEPAPFATVRLHTASGWSTSAVADEEGVARFRMVRDYFPEWGDFDPRHRQEFLAVATIRTGESGTYEGARYDGIRYVATLPGSYYPSSSDYNSYGYGLLIGLFALTFTGVAVYLYRRRRVRPLREVRFDE